ncbi:MAG: hypothetical protein M5R36_00485 [Deltaproteobacteria bacterium]|nr:hypothetical protein [Deltaproteobacteria bacterium]
MTNEEIHISNLIQPINPKRLDHRIVELQRELIKLQDQRKLIDARIQKLTSAIRESVNEMSNQSFLPGRLVASRGKPVVCGRRAKGQVRKLILKILSEASDPVSPMEIARTIDQLQHVKYSSNTVDSVRIALQILVKEKEIISPRRGKYVLNRSLSTKCSVRLQSNQKSA